MCMNMYAAGASGLNYELVSHWLTLWAVAGLGVAALHCSGFGVGVTVFHRIEVPR